MDAVTVAFDVGPLAGPLTGIGTAVSHLRSGLDRRDGIHLMPYLTSFRADPAPGTRRLPLPAAVAHRLWGATGRPRVDRWLAGAEVVHGTNYVVPPTRLPRLVSVYDCWFLDHPEQAHPDVRRAGEVLRRSIADGAVVHVSSRATEQAMRRRWPTAEIHMIHLGATVLCTPPETAPFPELAGAPFVLALGTIERRKNLPALVTAFGRLAPGHPELRLVLAGGAGDDGPSVDAAIASLPERVAARVMRPGRVDDPTRSWLLHHARVLAYPSLDEGFGFPLLDAMQAGVPIVAADVGSIPEVAGDAALLVSPHDVEALGLTLERALTDDGTRSALIRAGHMHVGTFTWGSTTDRMATLYRELAERRRR